MITSYGWYRIGKIGTHIGGTAIQIGFLVGGGFLGKFIGNKIPFLNTIPTWIPIVAGCVIGGFVSFLILFIIDRIKSKEGNGTNS